MSFGDHLEELRSCMLWALVGVVAGAIVSLVFGKEILAIIFAPLLFVQNANGLPMELLALAPTAGFVAYLKIGILSGLIISMPWVLFHAWNFVAAGLYKNERNLVLKLIPASVVLFVTGVLFFVLHRFAPGAAFLHHLQQNFPDSRSREQQLSALDPPNAGAGRH